MELLYLLPVVLVGAFVWATIGGTGGIAARARRVGPPEGGQRAPQLSNSTANLASLASRPGANAGAGFSREKELKAIDAFYANDLNAAHISLGSLIPHLITRNSLRRVAAIMADKAASWKLELGDGDAMSRTAVGMQREYLQGIALKAFEYIEFQRSLSAMSDEDRAALRLADLLCVVGAVSTEELALVRTPIIWSKGECLVVSPSPFDSADRKVALRDGLNMLLSGDLGEARTGRERLNRYLRRALEDNSQVGVGDRKVLERYIQGGARWMTPEEAATALASTPPKPHAVLLGRVRETEQNLFFDRNESIITIAPSGSGKTELLKRNLLRHMQGGAVVIDIKGDLWEDTAGWRAEQVGPVYRFNPAQPERSIKFNPLANIRTNPADAYEDAEKLVALLKVPTRVGEQKTIDYWETRGLDLLKDTILDVATGEPKASDRTLASVFMRLYLDGNKDFDPTKEPDLTDKSGMGIAPESELGEWMAHLKSTGIGKLVRQAKALENIASKQRGSIFEAARSNINIWEAPRFEELSTESTFDPMSLRRDNATLYITVTLDELAAYTSVIRALIGQTFYALCRERVPYDAPVVSFLLDEMPQLERMDVLEKALDVGRGYAVRLWMFAQNFRQLEIRYPNADGFLRNSFVRQYMGIGTEDALKFSRELDNRVGLLDGRRKPLVEPHQLYAEEFADLILTIARGRSPVALEKLYAFNDDECIKAPEH